MGLIIGIRREDKNEWERRVPLIPADLAELSAAHDVQFIAQPSPIRVFKDDEFREAGATVDEDLGPASVVVAVKEIPIDLLERDKVYFFFSHTVKGQDYNMPLLKRLLELNTTLIDYERIADDQGRRLIFFSLHAGYAGMLDSLWCLGRRLEHQGRRTPLLDVRMAHGYDSLEAAKEHLRELGARIGAEGLGERRRPIVIGVAGYGNVARGCNEILDCLPVREISVAELEAAAGGTIEEYGPLVKVVFSEEDMVERIAVPAECGAAFDLQEYYNHPEKYRGRFEQYLPHLDMLMNTIYWEEKYPRLVTREWAKATYAEGTDPRLQVIGDISCDIGGSIEGTLKAPQPDNPCFVWDAEANTVTDGVVGRGPVIMAVDNLPCELPRESSTHFSSVLRGMVPELVDVDFKADFAGLDLPPHLKKAVVAHGGKLAPDYEYLQENLDRFGG